jgi:DnaJ-class molecular chaperone
MKPGGSCARCGCEDAVLGLMCSADILRLAPESEPKPCEVCLGEKSLKCKECGGEGSYMVYVSPSGSMNDPRGKEEKERCEDCKGEGWRECSECEGSGVEAFRSVIVGIEEAEEVGA